jgi:hypothetical protein
MHAGTPIAHDATVFRYLLAASVIAGFWLAPGGGEIVAARSQDAERYRIVTGRDERTALLGALSGSQLAVLEKLNRADTAHLARLRAVVVPTSWTDDELAYSPLPLRYPAVSDWSKFLVVHAPGQLFGAYESGTLVRWGPVSTGGRNSETAPGMFRLNWRSTGRTSTVDPDWFLPWYFNFASRDGLAFHAYALPGLPASHGCIRLLERDAQWLYAWGEPWVLDAQRAQILAPGTPVLIAGRYDFQSPPPWRSLPWLAQTMELPAAPLTLEHDTWLPLRHTP